MFRTIYCFLYLVFSTAFKIPQMNKIKKLKSQSCFTDDYIQEYVEVITSNWALAQLRATSATIKVTGYENIPKSQAVLFVSNHQSDYDIPIFMGLIRKPKGFIAKIEVKKIPLIRTWMQFMNCIFIDRNDLRQSASAILKGVQLLKSGHSMVVFPEGTRSKCNIMGEFKQGSFKLATKSNVPIVPVTICGSFKIMEHNKGLIKPADVRVFIHKPIIISELSKEQLTNISDIVKEIIQQPLVP